MQSSTATGFYAVKIKTHDSKVFQFLTPDGYLTRLRIHAGMSTKENAEAVAARLADNPVVAAVKVVKF